MRQRTLKFGLAAATVAAAVLPLALAIQPAGADYAPNQGDVVGVGSDTLQYMLDFLADGDAYGDPGYNQVGNKHKVDNIDASADTNGRLAYGVDGGQVGQGTCTPSTGGTAGTGNSTSANTGHPCVLNPTVVLRAGLQPVQRPNGSGAGFKALVQDIVAGHNTPATEVINFSRASAAQSTTATLPAGVNIDQLSVATDTLPMITSSGANPTHAVPLSASQLSLIYSQNTGSCITWNNPQISGVWLESAVTNSTTTVSFPGGDPQQPTSANDGWVVQGSGIPTGDTVASVGTDSITLTTAATSSNTESIGLVNPSASSRAIIPIIPQVGSGTRSFFLSEIGLSGPGECPVVAEENDPTAVYDVTSGDSADAIEPMSQGRLDLYEGLSNTGGSEGLAGTGYFSDPSCPYLVGTSACGTGSVSGGSSTYVPNAVLPAVTAITTGSPAGLGAYPASGGLTSGLFDVTRTLYLYFRNSDITSTTAWQPGTTLNWLRTLFYNPCEVGQSGCITSGGSTYGSGGAPYIQQTAGQTDLEDAGVTPEATEVCTEISNGYASC